MYWVVGVLVMMNEIVVLYDDFMFELLNEVKWYEG